MLEGKEYEKQNINLKMNNIICNLNLKHNKIKQKRIELRLSQQQLANNINIDQSDLSKIEKGIFNISVKMLNRIADGLNCKLDISLS